MRMQFYQSIPAGIESHRFNAHELKLNEFNIFLEIDALQMDWNAVNLG